MARYLDEVDFIDMTGTADRAPLEQAGVRYHRPADGGGSRIASINLQRLLARLRPDVIVCHYASGDHFFNAIAYGRCPVTVIAMGTDILYDKGDTRVMPMRRFLVRMGLRRAAYVCAKSKFIAEAARSRGYAGRMDVNFWGSDLRRFRPGDAAQARRDLGLFGTGPVVLSPRAIAPLYKIDLIIEAFATVVKHHPDARLVILGRSVPAYLAAVNERIYSLGLTESITVLGHMAQDALPAWYQASDVVVSVASVEGFPNTVLEVMACGVPLLVGDIPQVGELLANGVSARVCATEPHAIAQGLLELLGDRVAAMAIAGRARETAIHAGDIDANGRRFAAEIRDVVKTESPPGALGLLLFRTLLVAYLGFKRFFPGVHGKLGAKPSHAT